MVPPSAPRRSAMPCSPVPFGVVAGSKPLPSSVTVNTRRPVSQSSAESAALLSLSLSAEPQDWRTIPANSRPVGPPRR
jgi:hypothetical protein